MHTKNLQMDAVSNKLKQDALEVYKASLIRSFEASPEQTVLFSHFGNLNQPKINSLIHIAEQLTLDNGIKRKIMKRVCSVLIENLQNISIHGAMDVKGNHHAMVILTFDGDYIRIHSGNLIHNDEISAVDFKLSEINKLSAEELRKLYIETLCNENFSDKGGAGLGLLTIAKKVDLPIEFNFTQIDEQQSYMNTVLKLSVKDS